jgi:histidinol phosphatase-like PHP family hydrolase
MIDLHTHTLFSDGVLLPSELIRRAYIAGYRAIAITDHVDSSNIDFVIPRVIELIKDVSEFAQIEVFAGAEITHVPPKLIGKLVARARELGAKIVVVHGETVAEPVAPGTNSAAIAAGADILTHPGLITKEDALKAADAGVALEITTRKGHSITNGHVYRMAVETGADLVLSSDAHSPDDLISLFRAKVVLRGAGVPEDTVDKILANSQKILDRVK